MTSYDELTIAKRIRELPPAPEAWVEAAKRLPRTRRQLDRLLPMIERDAELREAMLRDLEGALEAVGAEPDPGLVAALRSRLEAGAED